MTGQISSDPALHIAPYLSGDQFIPPILVEFVDHRRARNRHRTIRRYEILTDRIDFVVKSVVPDNAARELKPPLGELDLIAERSRSVVVWAVLDRLPR